MGLVTPSFPIAQRRIPVDEQYGLSVVSRRKLTRGIDQVTNTIPNSPAEKLARHQVSLPFPWESWTTLPPPSLPTRPGSPILIGPSSEVFPMAGDDSPLWNCEELTNHRAFLAKYSATIAN